MTPQRSAFALRAAAVMVTVLALLAVVVPAWSAPSSDIRDLNSCACERACALGSTDRECADGAHRRHLRLHR